MIEDEYSAIDMLVGGDMLIPTIELDGAYFLVNGTSTRFSGVYPTPAHRKMLSDKQRKDHWDNTREFFEEFDHKKREETVQFDGLLITSQRVPVGGQVVRSKRVALPCGCCATYHNGRLARYHHCSV